MSSTQDVIINIKANVESMIKTLKQAGKEVGTMMEQFSPKTTIGMLGGDSGEFKLKTPDLDAFTPNTKEFKKFFPLMQKGLDVVDNAFGDTGDSARNLYDSISEGREKLSALGKAGKDVGKLMKDSFDVATKGQRRLSPYAVSDYYPDPKFPDFKSLYPTIAPAAEAIQKGFDTASTSAKNLYENIRKGTPRSSKLFEGLQTRVAGVSEKFKSWNSDMSFIKKKTDEAEKPLTKLSYAYKVASGSIDNFFKKIGNVGRQMSWFGFRLTMMGRQMSRFVMKPINKAIQLFKGWEKAMIDIGIGMGFMMMQGTMTSSMFEMMQGAMLLAPGVGMQLQTVFSAIAALLIQIGADILPILIPKILELVEVLWELWKLNKDKVINVIEELSADAIGGLIVALIEGGAAFVDSFVAGLRMAYDWAKRFYAVIQPHLPFIIKWGAILLGLSPILSAVGTALFMLSVPLQLLSWMWSGIIGEVVSLIRFLGLLTRLLMGVLPVGLLLVVGALLLAAAGLGLFGDAGKEAFDKILGYITTTATTLVEKFTSLSWTEIWELGTSALTTVWDTVAEIVSPIVKKIKDGFEKLKWKEIWEKGKALFKTTWEKIDETARGIAKKISDEFKKIKWKEMWEEAVDTLKTLKTGFADALIEMQETFITVMADIITYIDNTSWAEAFDSLRAVLREIYDYIKLGFEEVWDDVTIIIDNVSWNTVFASLIAFGFELAGLMIDAFLTGWWDMNTAIQTEIYDLMKWAFEDGAANFANTLYSTFFTIGISLAGGLMNGVLDRMPGWLKGLLGIDEDFKFVIPEFDVMFPDIPEIPEVPVVPFVYGAGKGDYDGDFIPPDPGEYANVANVIDNANEVMKEAIKISNDYVDGGGAAADTAGQIAANEAKKAAELQKSIEAMSSMKNITEEYISEMDKYEDQHDNLFRHSVGTDILRNMEEASLGFNMATEAANAFNNEIARAAQDAISYSPDAPVFIGPIRLDIVNDFSDLTIYSEMDLDIVTDIVSRRIAEAVNEVITR